MNLIEAVKTRKPFRRKVDVLTYGESFYVDFMSPGSRTVALGYEDIIAEDWEVEETKKRVGENDNLGHETVD